MAPLPNNFLCLIAYVIGREKQRKLLGGGAIADGTTDGKNAIVVGPLLFSRDHVRDRTKEAVGRRRHRGRRNGRKKREFRRPFKLQNCTYSFKVD
jgi:hypothetical protein